MAEAWVALHTLEEFVEENKYKVTESNRFLSRCFEGLYTGDNLEPLAIAGSDPGETAMMIAAVRQYGIQVEPDKVVQIFVELVGGPKNVRMHTHANAPKGATGAGCLHLQQIAKDPQAYGLVKEDVAWMIGKATWSRDMGAVEKVLEGNHQEQAILMIRGTDYSIVPSSGNRQVFVFHRGLADLRHKAICHAVVEHKAVVLPEGCDEEYLYQIVSEVSEDHFMETIKRIAPGLPIFSVDFKPDGSFSLESLGKVA